MFLDRLAMRLLAAALCAATVPSCFFRSRARPIKGPDGTAHFFIECKKSPEHCYEEAADRCPDGYRIVDSSGRSGGAAVYQDALGTSIVQSYRGTMLIKCR
jgi:hypothetical protein